MHGFVTGDRVAIADVPADVRERMTTPSITIVRHGRPALDRSQLMDSERFVTWWDEYDAGGLASDGQCPGNTLRAAGAEAAVIVASTLRRAQETAAAIAPGRPILTDEIFVEARLPPPRLPSFFRFRPPFWGVLARIWWWLGNARDEETRPEAEKRAAEAARRLIALAEEHGPVMLVAHGWFNRMMRPVLRAHGWHCVADGGDSYWSFRRYEKRG